MWIKYSALPANSYSEAIRFKVGFDHKTEVVLALILLINCQSKSLSQRYSQDA